MPTFDDLKYALRKALKAHYQRYREMHPVETYYGYSLYTDSDVSSFGSVATRASAIKVREDDEMYVCYCYGQHEWPDFEDFGLFDDANRILKEMYTKGGLSFEEYKKQSLENGLEVLKELENEGFFGAREDNRYVVLWISDSADPIMDRAVKELNSANIWKAYATEYVNV